MSRAAPLPDPAATPPRADAGPENTLAGLLEGLARLDPDAAALADMEGREAWCGRAPGRYTRAGAALAMRDLSSRLLALDLPPGSAVGICLAGGTEACLAILAAERAGLVPVLLPVFAEEDDLERRLTLSDARAVVTQTRVGRLRPAATLCAVAARRFRLRFLLAFGPDVPDGVVDLDRPSSRGAGAPGPVRGASPGIVTFEDRADEPHALLPHALFRPSSSWLAAAALVLAATGWGPGDTVVTSLAPDDLKGLATGLVACLGAGAACEVQAVFDPDRLAAAVARHPRTHLVLPGWTERAVARLGLADGAASVVLVHDSPAALPSGTGAAPWRCPVVDAVALGETALLAARRDRRGRPAVPLAGAFPNGAGRPLLTVRTDAGGRTEARGWASVAVPFGGAASVPPSAGESWRACPRPEQPGTARLIRDDPVSEP